MDRTTDDRREAAADEVIAGLQELQRDDLSADERSDREHAIDGSIVGAWAKKGRDERSRRSA